MYNRNNKRIRIFLIIFLVTAIIPSVFADWIDLTGSFPKRMDNSEITLPPDIGEPEEIISDRTRAARLVRVVLQGFGIEDEKVDRDLYQHVYVPAWELQPEIGKPGVPIKPVYVEIPPYAAADARVVNKRQVELKQINVFPAQPPEIESIDEPVPFTIDSFSYKDRKSVV